MPIYELEITQDDLNEQEDTFWKRAAALAAKRVIPDALGVTSTGLLLVKNGENYPKHYPVPTVIEQPQKIQIFIR